MARKRRGNRRARNFVAIPFNHSVTVGALVAGTVVSETVLTFGEDLFLISTDMSVALRDSDAEDVLGVGLSHGDLSNAEIEECLSAELTDPDDIIAKERSRRPVRAYGLVTHDNRALEHGSMVRRKCKFSIGDGHELKVWVRSSGSNDQVSGAFVQFTGTVFGRWQR